MKKSLLTFFCATIVGVAIIILVSILANASTAVLLAPWVIFALLAAFGDAGVGFIDEYLLRKIKHSGSKIEVNAPVRLLLISGFFGVVVSLSIYLLSFGEILPTIAFNRDSLILGVTAGFMEVMWMIPYFYALDRSSAINATPLFQTIPIFTLIIGISFFAEIPSFLHVIAAALILFGGIILNYSPELKKLDKKTILLMVVSSAVVSTQYFVFREAAAAGNFSTAVFFNGIGMLIFSTLLWLLIKSFREQLKDFLQQTQYSLIPIQFFNETLYALSTMAAQFAIVVGPSVMLVTSLNAFHPIFTLIIGISLAALGVKEQQQVLSIGKSYLVIGILTIAAGTLMISI